MKHGPIALVDSEMPVVVIAPTDSLYDKIISYYESNADRIVSEAQLLAKSRNYEEAFFRLSLVPDVCKCYTEKILPVALDLWQVYVDRLSLYMASTGKQYASHAATIRRWAAEDSQKDVPQTRNRDYRVEEGETV